MNRMLKTGLGSLAVLMALTAGSGRGVGAQAAPPTDPAAVLAAFEAGVGNPASVDAQLALVTGDAVQTISPAPQGTSGVWTGTSELKQAFEYAVAHKVKRALVGSPQVNGTKVTDTVMTTNDFFLLIGVAPVKFTTEAVVEGGKIKSYATTMAPEERARVGAAAAAYQQAHPAPATDPAAVLAAFESAIGNPAAVDAALALVTADAVQTINPPPQGTTGVWTGTAELKQAFDYAVAHKVKRELVGSPQVTGNKVTDTVMTTNDFFLMIGVAPVKFTTEAVIEGGKIKSYTTTMAPEERARVGAAAAAFQQAHPAPATDPAAILAVFEAGVGNPASVDAQLALVTSDAVQTISPAPQGTTGVWTGTSELKQAFEYAVAHKVKRELVGSPQVNGNKATDTVMTTNDFFLLIGVAPVKFTTEAVIEGGKIKSYTTTMAPEERARVGAAAAAYQQAQATTPPPGMPATGNNTLLTLLGGLLALGLLFLGAGVVTRGRHSRA